LGAQTYKSLFSTTGNNSEQQYMDYITAHLSCPPGSNFTQNIDIVQGEVLYLYGEYENIGLQTCRLNGLPDKVERKS